MRSSFHSCQSQMFVNLVEACMRFTSEPSIPCTYFFDTKKFKILFCISVRDNIIPIATEKKNSNSFVKEDFKVFSHGSIFSHVVVDFRARLPSFINMVNMEGMFCQIKILYCSIITWAFVDCSQIYMLLLFCEDTTFFQSFLIVLAHFPNGFDHSNSLSRFLFLAKFIDI